MSIPQRLDIIDVFLQPGELFFGDEQTRIRTLLGSCVAVTLWHPARRIGGMCHYMLPRRPQRGAGDRLDGRYADEAMALFVLEVERSGTRPPDYHAKLFGGGRMFRPPPAAPGHADISQRNVAAGHELVVRHGFRLQSHDLGGPGHRLVILDVWSGDVWVKRAAAARG